MAAINGICGDYGYTITFNIQMVNSQPFDLSDCFVNMRAKLGEKQPISRDCVIADDPTTGVCAYTVQPNDFTVSGTYNVELIITNTSQNKVTTAQGIVFTVMPRKT